MIEGINSKLVALVILLLAGASVVSCSRSKGQPNNATASAIWKQ